MEDFKIEYRAAPGGDQFVVIPYSLKPMKAPGRPETPPGWRPSFDDSPLGKRAPFDWSADHYTKYVGRFEPAATFANLVALCDFAASHPAHKDDCLKMADEFVDLIMRNSIVHDSMRFVFRDYAFRRRDRTISAGWVNALSNAFILRGLAALYKIRPTRDMAMLMDELASAFLLINNPERRLPRPWFTYIDENNNLWFDEYPCDDGLPTLVLNGHIHSIYGLIEYSRARPQANEWVSDFILGGIATMRRNAERFRRPGRINLYSLREPIKDYAPHRTVRQQKELWRITRDPWFRDLSALFEEDIIAHGRRLERRQRSYRSARSNWRKMAGPLVRIVSAALRVLMLPLRAPRARKKRRLTRRSAGMPS